MGSVEEGLNQIPVTIRFRSGSRSSKIYLNPPGLICCVRSHLPGIEFVVYCILLLLIMMLSVWVILLLLSVFFSYDYISLSLSLSLLVCFMLQVDLFCLCVALFHIPKDSISNVLLFSQCIGLFIS